MKTLLDKDVLLVLSGLFTNLAAAWFGSIFILPAVFKISPLLLTVNISSGIVALVLAVLLTKKGK